MDRGIEREKRLSKRDYLSEGYFSRKQWDSYYFQVSSVYGLITEGTVLEVGRGSGFVGGILESIGFTVESVDVNENLHPTYVGDISSEAFEIDNVYDCVLCAEVLEHIPLKKLEVCLSNIKRLSSKYVIITLPNCEHFSKIDIRLNDRRIISLKFGKKKSDIAPMHFWELNSDELCTNEAITNIIKKHFNILKEDTVFGSEYHYYYILEK